MSRPAIVIGAIGTHGDLNPMLTLGAALARRGYRCCVLAGAWQEAAVRKVGLDFHPILSEMQFRQFNENLRTVSSPGADWITFFYDAVFPATGATFEFVRDRCARGGTVLIGASHVIGLRLAAERFGIPLVTTNVQPESLRPSRDDEFSIYMNGLLTRLLDQHRRNAGLAPASLPFIEWLDADRTVVSLFPEWFLVPGIDGPAHAQGRMLDFIFDDPHGGARASRALDAFLAAHDAPIVFTAGTGATSVREFFAAAVDSAAALSRPALLLTKAREQVPDPLPHGMLHVDYLPFAELLPYVGGIVHHGGIGTFAQSLRAGIPQIIMPGGFDQFGNAAKAVAFGVGERIDPAHLDARELASKLDVVLQRGTTATQCRAYRDRFDPAHTLDWCCDALEAVMMRAA